MISFQMELTELRRELQALKLSELKKIASAQYALVTDPALKRSELIEEIIGEEYRIACK